MFWSMRMRGTIRIALTEEWGANGRMKGRKNTMYRGIHKHTRKHTRKHTATTVCIEAATVSGRDHGLLWFGRVTMRCQEELKRFRGLSCRLSCRLSHR